MTKVMDVIANACTASLVPSDSIAFAAQQMRETGAAVLPVCENGRFQGTVTERDIVLYAVADELEPSCQVKAVMRNHLPTVAPEDDVVHALDLMVASGARALPIIHESRFIGLLTLDDLARESPALAALAFYRIAKVQVARLVKA